MSSGKYQIQASQTLVNGASGGGGAEIVVFTSPPLSPMFDNTQILIWAIFSGLMGTGVTSYILRIRQGTTTGGTIVNSQTLNPGVAGARVLSGFMGIDIPGTVAGQQYSLTFQGAAETAATSFGNGAIAAMVM